MGSTTRLSLLILSISFLVTTAIAQTACRAHTFTNNQQYSSCSDLPELNSFLYWTYDSTAGTANIAFRTTGVSPTSNWIAWALNPTGSGMVGAQALVAYQNSSSSSVYAYTSSVTSTSTTLARSSISFRVSNLSATSGTNEMTIFATIRPPSTTVNQVWQVGPLTGGNPGQHSQNSANTKSSGSINFLSGQATAGGATIQRLKQKNTHGVLNAISWGILMPLGAIIARYVKVFPSADPAWFYLHIACQISAYIIGVAGWGTGLKLGSQSVGIVYHVHRNIGIALFCLATLQVFALLLRPNKDHKYRLYWKVYHHGIGYIVIILSIINIYQGFDKVLMPEKKWKRIYSGILIALGAIALVLEAFTWTVVYKKKKTDQQKHGHHANGTNGFANSYA
ncbi:cytochrome b561 and DOMON domain-containing protein At5g35735-like [Chenopodium quinoa]|uniref:Cytochrome b561 and DOMON domain-containing protein n=1 Tax=Chenopodium quinoa TaxID=63459 RepID=A0A803LRF4_CHEQI|nr:cytochrome b561 and DOMON domain-containing protein At5g35735-like [Chenopodium quinoa]